MRLSASKMALWALCRFWAREDVALTDTGPEGARDLGLAFHDANEAKRRGMPVELDAIAAARHLTDAQRESLKRMHDTFNEKVTVIPVLCALETTWVFDPITGGVRDIGSSLNRKYVEAGMLPHEIPGTADVSWVLREGEGKARRKIVCVGDTKTGYQADLEDAAYHAQLLFLGMCMAKLKDADAARIYVWKVTEDDVIPTFYEMDRAEIDLIARDLMREVAAFHASPPEPQPGAHCSGMWCPAALDCPSARVVAVAAISETQLVPVHRLRGPIQSHDEAGYRLAHLGALKAFTKAYEDDLQTYAEDHGGIDTPEGPWGPHTSDTDKILPTPDTFAVLEEILGEEGVHAATTVDVTKASIKRAVQAKGMKPVEPAVKSIVEEIRKAGGIVTGKTTRFGVRKGNAA